MKTPLLFALTFLGVAHASVSTTHVETNLRFGLRRPYPLCSACHEFVEDYRVYALITEIRVLWSIDSWGPKCWHPNGTVVDRWDCRARASAYRIVKYAEGTNETLFCSYFELCPHWKPPIRSKLGFRPNKCKDCEHAMEQLIKIAIVEYRQLDQAVIMTEFCNYIGKHFIPDQCTNLMNEISQGSTETALKGFISNLFCQQTQACPKASHNVVSKRRV